MDMYPNAQVILTTRPNAETKRVVARVLGSFYEMVCGSGGALGWVGWRGGLLVCIAFMLDC